jgi:hypothetical protein
MLNSVAVGIAPLLLYHRKCRWCFCPGNQTPALRKGPLGPKTLCNACGVYFNRNSHLPPNRYLLKANRHSHQLDRTTRANTEPGAGVRGRKKKPPPLTIARPGVHPLLLQNAPKSCGPFFLGPQFEQITPPTTPHSANGHGPFSAVSFNGPFSQPMANYPLSAPPSIMPAFGGMGAEWPGVDLDGILYQELQEPTFLVDPFEYDVDGVFSPACVTPVSSSVGGNDDLPYGDAWLESLRCL